MARQHIGGKERKAERARRAFELRKAGKSLREIGEALAVSHETIRKDLAEVLTAYREEAVDKHKAIVAIELARLDDMLFGLWMKARDGNTRSVDAVLRIMERRAKLLGLDAPAAARTVQLSMTPTEIVQMSDDDLAELIAQLERT